MPSRCLISFDMYICGERWKKRNKKMKIQTTRRGVITTNPVLYFSSFFLLFKVKTDKIVRYKFNYLYNQGWCVYIEEQKMCKGTDRTQIFLFFSSIQTGQIWNMRGYWTSLTLVDSSQKKKLKLIYINKNFEWTF